MQHHENHHVSGVSYISLRFASNTPPTNNPAVRAASCGQCCTRHFIFDMFFLSKSLNAGLQIVRLAPPQLTPTFGCKYSSIYQV